MSFVIFAALVAAAAFTGAQFEPGEWYAQAAKPSWTPPNWVFAPVWTALYVAIDLTLLLATIIVFIALALRHSRLASGLFVPICSGSDSPER